MSNNPDMSKRVAENLADLWSSEIESDCPEESMSCTLFDVGANLIGSRFENGVIVLTFLKGGNKYELDLVPANWRHKR